MKRIIAAIFLLALTGCVKPLPSSAYVPANPEYEMPLSFYLKGKIAVGEVTNSYKQNDIVTGEEYAKALRRILKQAKLLAWDEKEVNVGEGKRTRYILNADIVDYRWPGIGLFHMKAGAAVSYTLIDTQNENDVYAATITSTQDDKKTIFDDTEQVMRHAVAVALGENAAQLAQQLATLTPQDLAKKTRKKSNRGDHP